MSPLHAESDKQVGTRQLTFTIKRRHRECFNDEGTVVLTFIDRGYEFIRERLINWYWIFASQLGYRF